jgi:hypothetical protein
MEPSSIEQRTIEAGQIAVFSEILAEGEFISAMDATLSGEPINFGVSGAVLEHVQRRDSRCSPKAVACSSNVPRIFRSSM